MVSRIEGFDFETIHFVSPLESLNNLELRCPQSVNGIAIDPEPDWSFDALLSELNASESKLNSSSSSVPVPFTKMKSREFLSAERGSKRSPAGAFVMHLSDDDDDEIDDDYDSDDKEDESQCLVTGSRFTCDDLYLSDIDDSDFEVQSSLMDKVGATEGVLIELSNVQRFGVKEEIRNQFFAFETNLMGQYEKSTYTTVQIEKYRDARREMDKKLDIQYQRKIAEALDNHLTAIQRDHELKSQIEERRINATYENAKMKEKALQEEKRRQEKAIAEAEAIRKRGEEERITALEAERKTVEEAAKREAADERAAYKLREATGSQIGASSGNTSAQSKGPASIETKKSQTGNILKAAESALHLELERLQKLKELDETNHSVRLSSIQNYSTYERQIARWTKLITGSKESVRTKADELIKILNDPRCPQSISIAAFAQKVVSQCERSNNSAFACGHVIVLLTSQVPHAMDIILAEFHKACIYTVPKHISYSKSVFESEEAYYKAIGYREADGKLETQDAYLSRLEAYIKLYGALVQTQVVGVQNVHGLKEGWAWLARFLNSLPPNKYTAVALAAFLKMAGFALFRKYRSQFKKMLDFIAQNFLNELNTSRGEVVNKVATEIRTYIEDKRFLDEPEGWNLPDTLLSSNMGPDSGYRDPYYNSSNRNFY